MATEAGWLKLLVIGLILVVAWAYLSPETFPIKMSQTVNQGESGETTITTPSGGTTQIIAISSVNLKPTFVDALNESAEFINPTFYIWREGATKPVAVSVSGGSASVAVKPGEHIKWAAGSDGSYYWKTGELTVGVTDTPIQIELYKIPSASGVRLQVFDTSYHDLTNGAYNLSLAAGQDFNLQVMFDVVEEYSAIFRPHICVAYTDANINKVKIAGLYEVDAPTRIISGLDQCFDTGLTYYTDKDPRQIYDVSVDVVPGKSLSGDSMTWYLIDKDIWYMDGKEYFVNPLTNANMGSTFEWNATIYFQ